MLLELLRVGDDERGRKMCTPRGFVVVRYGSGRSTKAKEKGDLNKTNMVLGMP